MTFEIFVNRVDSLTKKATTNIAMGSWERVPVWSDIEEFIYENSMFLHPSVRLYRGSIYSTVVNIRDSNGLIRSVDLNFAGEIIRVSTDNS